MTNRLRLSVSISLATYQHVGYFTHSAFVSAGREVDPVTEDIDLDKSNTSPFRRQKDSFLGYAVYTEQLKEEMKMHTKPIEEQHVPYKAFYNDQSGKFMFIMMAHIFKFNPQNCSSSAPEAFVKVRAKSVNSQGEGVLNKLEVCLTRLVACLFSETWSLRQCKSL